MLLQYKQLNEGVQEGHGETESTENSRHLALLKFSPLYKCGFNCIEEVYSVCFGLVFCMDVCESGFCLVLFSRLFFSRNLKLRPLTTIDIASI